MSLLTHKKIKVLGTEKLEDVIPYILQPSDNGKKKHRRNYYYGDRKFSVKLSGQRMALLAREKECACCGYTGVIFRLEIAGCYSPHFNLYAAHPEGLILMTMDHILPKSHGGQTTEDNLQLLCKTCNEKKRNRLIEIPDLRKELGISDDLIKQNRQLAVDWLLSH